MGRRGVADVWACIALLARASASPVHCLKYGMAMAPNLDSNSTFKQHAIDCQGACASSSGCFEFQYFENGQCLLHHFRQRRLLGADAALSEEAFNSLPMVIRGNVRFDMMTQAYEAMTAMWDEQPFKPIYSKDLAKWGAVYPGRVEGRVIASLKQLGVVNVKRDGGIMLRHYPESASAKAALKLSAPEGFARKWAGTPNDDDRRKSDHLAPSLELALRYAAGPPSCPRFARLPIIYMAPFMNGLIRVKTKEGEKARDAAAWQEFRPPLSQRCHFTEDGAGPREAVLVKAPRLCQAECAGTSTCAWFSYSHTSHKCRLHGLQAQR